MAQQKFYVVWYGREPGVYSSWNDCKQQIEGFPGAQYKSFKTKQAAEEAFQNSGSDYIGKNNFESELTEEQKKLIGDYNPESICVDAACNGATGEMEYQGVYTKTGKNIFLKGPYQSGTNNIGEFLAIVHALALLKQKNWNYPVYSDSKIAIGWVKKKKCETKQERNLQNKNLFELIARAEKWLNENTYATKILKWETKAWGENKADFGRK